MSSEAQSCPCQSGTAYADCCEPYHKGLQHAPTAVALMRSRYCAYALGLVDYLINTTHRDNHQYRKNTKVWRAELITYCRQLKFQSLIILEEQPGETESCVTFEAVISHHQGKMSTMFEKSRFVKLGNRWLYHSGESKVSEPV